MGTSFFSSPSLAMPTAIAMNVWWGYPFMTIVLLAGLKGIDQTLYEAARVDGASAVQEFFNITLPGLWPYIAIAVLLRGMWIFTFFDPIWLLTRGGPTYKTLIIPIMAYLDTFTSYQLGKGCALVVMLLIIQLIYLIFFFKVYKYEEVDER